MTMTVPVPLSLLTTPSTPEEELAELLALAAAVQLPTTSWVEGDVTLTLLETVAQRLSMLSQVIAPMAAGGFLDYARGSGVVGIKGWLDILAKQVFGEDRIDATFASTNVTLTNTLGPGGNTYTIAANDLTVEDSLTGKTYKNSEPAVGTVTLAPGGNVSLMFVADEIGPASSAGPGEIDTLVSTLLGVTVSNATSAVGLDEESDDALKNRCRLKVPAISRTAASPAGKYAYVAITPSENNGANVNRAIVVAESATGNVTVVLAGPSGAVDGSPGGDVDKVESALIQKVCGPVETLTVESATNNTVSPAYAIWVYDDINLDTATIKTQIAAKLALLFGVSPIGGWKKTGDPSGKVWIRLLESVIRSVSPRIFEVEVSLPSSDVTIGATEVPVLGTPTGTINFETPPATGGTI
jgi:hypothetical protein